MRREFADQVNLDGEHHDDRNVQVYVREVCKKLRVGYGKRIQMLRTGGEIPKPTEPFLCRPSVPSKAIA